MAVSNPLDGEQATAESPRVAVTTFITRLSGGSGLRVAVKDMLDTGGLPTTVGCRAVERRAIPPMRTSRAWWVCEAPRRLDASGSWGAPTSTSWRSRPTN